jgi:hypothetical protein
MKFAEIKHELLKKNYPEHRIEVEAKNIQKSAKEISQDSGVPVRKIAQMILDRINHVGSTKEP